MPSRVYTRSFTIPSDAIDENGHVNNVAYVQWMHAESALPSNTTHPSAASKRKATRQPGSFVSTRSNTSSPPLQGKSSRSGPGWKTSGASGHCANMNLSASQMEKPWSKAKPTGSLWTRRRARRARSRRQYPKYLLCRKTGNYSLNNF